MSYIVPIHRPTSVRHALKLPFLSPSADALVVAKANRLEIYNFASTPDGFSLDLVHSSTVYGYITMLAALPPNPSTITKAGTSHLLVGTDRYQYFTCSWDSQSKSLRTEKNYVDQADKVLRDSRESDRVHVDPSGRFITLELFDGVITVLHAAPEQLGKRRKSGPLNKDDEDPAAGGLGNPIQVRVEEMLTRSSGFVQNSDRRKNPRFAVLWEDNTEVPQLKIRELKYTQAMAGEPSSAELETVAELRTELDLGVSHLIPVSAPYGGFLVLGERSIAYVDSDLTDVISQELEDNATIWTCWVKVDDRRWLLADDYGRLYFLMISTSNDRVENWRLDLIGTASKASCLVYLDEGYVFVGSHSGDSQVIQIVERGLDVVQSISNIAPILDFSLMDLGRGSESGHSNEFSSGQARIVTASGAWQDGSIRSVRSGVGIEELGTIGQLSHITDLWALSSTGADDIQDTLLVTFVDETRIFKFDSEAAVEEVDTFNGLELSETTLFACNLSDGRLLQVHESGVRIADLESGMTVSHWKPPNSVSKITTACANSAHLLVVEGGHTIHLFDTSNGLSPTISKTFPASSQIASVTVPPSPSSVCIVSFWQSASVSILDLDFLEPLHTQTLGAPGRAIPRSVLIADVVPDSPPTLFIAMADGTVMTYSFDMIENTLSGSNRIILGSEPVFFKALPRDPDSGLSSVFASCEQPSLIYASDGRIVYSAINSDKASRVAYFNCAAYAGSIAIATPDELKLAIIDTERTTQLQTLHIGETVRCLAYSPEQKIFGMGCIRRILESGAEALMSSVKIADEVNFRELDSYELDDNELVECIIPTGQVYGDEDGEEGSPGSSDMFVVGTSLLAESSGGEDGVKGRIIVFEVNKEQKLKKMTDLAVKGACRSLAMCDGRIVAGLVKTVVLYALTPSSDSSRSSSCVLSLTKLATYRTSTNPLSLCVTPATADSPATVAVADLMKSLSILTVLPPGSTLPDSPSSAPPTSKGKANATASAGPSTQRPSLDFRLIESSRHFATLWSSACCTIDANQWLVADMEGNLVVLRRNIGGVTVDDRRRLEVISEGRLGEVVNKIVPISTPPAVGAAAAGGETNTDGVGPVITPRAFLATVEGGVYLFGTINEAYQQTLMRLQASLAHPDHARVESPGYMPWSKWRAFKTEVREADEPFRFVDGELLDAASTLPDAELEAVLRDMGTNTAPAGRDWLSNVKDGAQEVKDLLEALRRLR